MPGKFKFTDAQRAEHNLPGEVSLDVYGNEILAGLSLDDTKWCLDIEARDLHDVSNAERARYDSLIADSWTYRKSNMDG
ncbi:hypothetical protein NKG60_26030 [Mesorhizobium sp. M1428]|uniref:hypothetical protein n=1 Tax=Mesorhizobium sp. M1428 TaxID=2957102 RepID=UPI003336335A